MMKPGIGEMTRYRGPNVWPSPRSRGRTFCLVLILLATPIAASAAPIVLSHVTLIDGTGAAARTDTTIVIEGRDIQAVYPSGSRPDPPARRSAISVGAP